MGLPADHSERLARARRCLDGLSIGDAFGERFFADPQTVEVLIQRREVPGPPWAFTDDTVMAISIVDALSDRADIDQDRLAWLLAARYRLDPTRGYDAMAHRMLGRFIAGEHWFDVAPDAFGGAGSMGNGGAVRASPIGAYFSDDLARAAEVAIRSAHVTHAHLEGQAGAAAVAVAAAWLAAGGERAADLFEAVLSYTPRSKTHARIARAAETPLSQDVQAAVLELGNGSRALAQDTVPFALWCAARHLESFEEALWCTVSGLGDRDTTCAIVGGIVALRAGATIPPEWEAARESLDRMDRSLL